MAYSEKGFGARIANAETLLAHLKSFSTYVAPSTDLSIAYLSKLIDTVKTHNNDTTSAIDEYSGAVDQRGKLFNKEPNSLQKLLSPINGSSTSAFGKKSKTLETILDLTRKIRGTKTIKLGKNPDAKAISESERSFGSMTQSLADLIVLLDNHSDKYKPVNKNIEVKALQDLHNNMILSGASVATTLGAQTISRDKRIQNYDKLNEITQRIKEEVKGQFTVSSSEYKLVKGLKI